MYPIFALWVRSHQDLPLNVYQIVNTFRYETKTTRPFIRVREIHFFEEHTCQVDEAAATGRVESNLAAFRAMAGRLGLHYVAFRRPEWDKFPGAFYTIAFDLPVGEARTLQLGSVHHYRENFSGPYGIQYEAADGTRKLVHQTTFGLSERLLGAIVAAHGDRRGIAFPSEVAPYQVVVVPIASKGGEDPLPWATEVAELLRGAGLRVHVDNTDARPGSKYYRWESQGVPLRLEIGGREAIAKSATTVDRLGHKGKAGPERLVEEVMERVEQYDTRLVAEAATRFKDSFGVAATLEELRGSTRVRFVSWCQKEDCGHRIEEAIDGALLGTLAGPAPLELPRAGACVGCGGTEQTVWAGAGRPL
jgi:prolyl-tRNA synthetase